MVDIFNKIILKVIAAKLTRDVGWLKIRNRPLELMADVLHRFLRDMSIRVYRYAEISGRTEPSVNDIILVLQDMNINIIELDKYKHRTKSVATIFPISQYPVPSPDKLTPPSVLTELDDNAKLNSEIGSACGNSPSTNALPSVITELDDNAKLNSENESACGISPSTNADVLLQNDFDVTSGCRDEQYAFSFFADESEKRVATDVGRNENEMEELNEKNMTSVPKAKRTKRRKTDKPEHVASCKSNTTQSESKADEINDFRRVREDKVKPEKASMNDITFSDEMHIHLDFPKIIIKRIKAENTILENSNVREISGNSSLEETNISVQRKTKRKPGVKKVRNIKKATLRGNANLKDNEKMCAILF